MPGRQNPLVRDTDTGSHLELLMVMSVVTILVSRAFLALSGYPRISPGNLHIAHMLWGGLLMFVALVLVFRYWNPSLRRFAAFVGGIGFGLFIDELGKFITEDNDYFYQPTIALLYVLFIIMYMLFRALSERSRITPEETEVNRRLRKSLGDMHDTSSRFLRWYDSARDRFHDGYGKLIRIRWLIPMLMILFVTLNLAQIGILFGMRGPGWLPAHDASGISLVGITAGGVMTIYGLIVLKRSQIRAFRWFRLSALTSVLITQTFLFYHSQFTALWGLGVNLLFYSGIRHHLLTLEENTDTEAGNNLAVHDDPD